MNPIPVLLGLLALAVVVWILHASGLWCRFRGHDWWYGTSIDETVKGRTCFRCGKKQTWWSRWFLAKHPSLTDDKPEDAPL